MRVGYTAPAVLLIVLLGGCTLLPGGEPRPETKVYLLKPEIPDLAAPPGGSTPCAGILVTTPEPAPGFGTARMMYRQDSYELDYFAYNEWAAPPTQMLEPLIGETLQSTGRFRAVLPPGASAGSSYRLETGEVRLVQMFPEGGRSHVELELQARLYRRAELLEQRRFRLREPAGAATPVAGVAAANRAAGRLLEQLGEWVVNRTREECKAAGSAALGAEVLFDRHDRGLHPGVHAEFAQHRFYVQLDGSVGDTQVSRNYLVALAFRQQTEDLHLPRG